MYKTPANCPNNPSLEACVVVVRANRREGDFAMEALHPCTIAEKELETQTETQQCCGISPSYVLKWPALPDIGKFLFIQSFPPNI